MCRETTELPEYDALETEILDFIRNGGMNSGNVDEQMKAAHSVNSAWDSQTGGSHYKTMKIQPMEFSMANNLNALQHTIIKYVCRDKTNRKEDLEKARHCIDMLLEWEDKNDRGN